MRFLSLVGFRQRAEVEIGCQLFCCRNHQSLLPPLPQLRLASRPASGIRSSQSPRYACAANSSRQGLPDRPLSRAMTTTCDYSAFLALAAFGLSPALAASSAMRFVLAARLLVDFLRRRQDLDGCRRPSRRLRSPAWRAPNTARLTLLLSSPPPSSLTPPLVRRISPPLTMAAASIVALISIRPASIAACSLPRLVSLSLTANEVLPEAALGQAPMQRHLAAFEALDAHAGGARSDPLPPRRRSCPCRSRCRGRCAGDSCGRPHCRRSGSVSSSSSSTSHVVMAGLVPAISLRKATPCPPDRGRRDRPGDDRKNYFASMTRTRLLDLADHALRLRRVRQFAGAADFVQLEADQRLALVVMAPRRARHLLDLDRLVSAMTSFLVLLIDRDFVGGLRGGATAASTL